MNMHFDFAQLYYDGMEPDYGRDVFFCPICEEGCYEKHGVLSKDNETFLCSKICLKQFDKEEQ